LELSKFGLNLGTPVNLQELSSFLKAPCRNYKFFAYASKDHRAGRGTDSHSSHTGKYRFEQGLCALGGYSGWLLTADVYDLDWDTEVKDGDVWIDINGLSLFIDQRSSLYIDGTELDFTDGLVGKGFHFFNPQVS